MMANGNPEPKKKEKENAREVAHVGDGFQRAREVASLRHTVHKPNGYASKQTKRTGRVKQSSVAPQNERIK